MNSESGLYVISLSNLDIVNLSTDCEMIEASSISQSILFEWIKGYEIEALGRVDNDDLQNHLNYKVNGIIMDNEISITF